MTDLNLDAIRARLNGITNGPWRVAVGGSTCPPITVDSDGVPDGGLVVYLDDGMEAEDRTAWWSDAEFIAHGRQDIPDLLAEIDQLEARMFGLHRYAADAEKAEAALADARATVAAQAAVIERVKALATVQARSCQAQHRADHARNWLDVLAIIEPVALAGPDGGEATAEPETPKPCQGFAWIGQSWAHCDRCSLPFWEHTHDEFREVLTPITPERAEASRQKWGE